MIRFYLALWLSKFYYFLTGHSNKDDKPGVIANKIDPDFLKKVAKPKITICITGTNGKTTTTNLVTAILKNTNRRVIANFEGANFRPGICKAYMREVSIFNKCKADIAVIEFDEITANPYLAYLKPNYVLVTNLSSDTMKRNAHTDYILDCIKKGLNDEASLVLNADDLITSSLGEGRDNNIYFSFTKEAYDEKAYDSLVKDIRICPKCHSLLKEDYIFYNHIGKLTCPNCGYTNPKADYLLNKIDYKNNTIDINGINYPMINNSKFNIYNELSAIAVLSEIGIENLDQAIAKVNVTKSRYDSTVCGGVEIVNLMGKGQNAIAVSRTLDYATKIEGNKIVILLLEEITEKEEYGTNLGEPISWIYDVDFELLKDDSVKEIVVGGTNYADYAVRFDLANIDLSKCKMVPEVDDITSVLNLEGIDKIVIVRDLYLADSINRLIEDIKRKIQNES